MATLTKKKANLIGTQTTQASASSRPAKQIRMTRSATSKTVYRSGNEPLTQDDLDLIEKLVAMPDSQIDYSDIPKGAGTFAVDRIGVQNLFKPIKQQITLRLDGDVIAWAKRNGEGYQTRINSALRKAMLDDLEAGFAKNKR